MTNREYFFGDKMIGDTIMLLTYDNHGRKECRDFKKILSEMDCKELLEWLNAERDMRFPW